MFIPQHERFRSADSNLVNDLVQILKVVEGTDYVIVGDMEESKRMNESSKDYMDIPIHVSGDNVPMPIFTFVEANLKLPIMDNLKRTKYDEPTPIQKYAIPIVLNGPDLIISVVPSPCYEQLFPRYEEDEDDEDFFFKDLEDDLDDFEMYYLNNALDYYSEDYDSD
ncbi:hypothetical protein V9T40_003418 [Parthenolecanium corni]|uniref:RNA helicase n=1 Tax=Parthenolecanium corni TaxID=536013 RepID=A0AAN9U122_9HEMI